MMAQWNLSVSIIVTPLPVFSLKMYYPTSIPFEAFTDSGQSPFFHVYTPYQFSVSPIAIECSMILVIVLM